jgi:HD-GYP domain-containing protein (c-di-GMP phosphodiesterase class II)
MSNMGADAVAHATAVAHLSLLLGIKLEMYLIQQRRRLPAHHAKEVVNLGVAGMLHDMGKLSLPGELQKYNGVNLPDDPEQLKAWQEHSQKGYDLVRTGVEPSAAAAILHHHQHWDGSGFPETVYRDGTTNHPSDTHIHIFARILAIANIYDRLATPLDSKHRRPNVQILHLLATQYASWCDPTILGMLRAVCPPFPPGTIVTLSDNTSAVVIQVEQSDPYRPAVKRVNEHDGQLDEKKLDLREDGSPTITHVGQIAVEALLPQEPSPQPASSAA